MKSLFISLFIIVSLSLSGQSPKDSVIYLSPIGETLDTVSVFAIIADIYKPLSLEKYRIITRSWVYPDKKVVPAEQWMEEATLDAKKIESWKKRMVWAIKEDDYYSN